MMHGVADQLALLFGGTAALCHVRDPLGCALASKRRQEGSR